MKMIHRLFILLFFVFFASDAAHAQILKKIKDRVAQTAENKVVNKAGDATEKSMDKMEDAAKGNKKQTSSKNNSDENVDNDNDPVTEKITNRSPAEPTLKTYSKFDFVPGEKTIFYEDFAPDAVGDFPARWNTNVSGEVRTVNNYPGKWFQLRSGGGFIPDGISDLPENFTIEFDIIMNHNNVQNAGGIYLDIYGGKAQNSLDDLYPGENGVKFYIGNRGFIMGNKVGDEHDKVSSNIENEHFFNNQGKVQRISIWRQKQRIRLYLNEVKIYDAPRIFPENTSLSLIRFFTWDCMDEDEIFLVSNIRVAVGAPDMRSKLIAEGKLVTQGILFDVNSDKIKPESAGTLKGIADILKENATVKVKIIGHTDSDGDDAANLTLSKKRSASVKNVLTKEYGIDASRMETDGLGESKPIADNNTSEGKATNRRVEFVKQ
ncbi:MAG: OmpA family protein [Ginsengibacter sp.]